MKKLLTLCCLYALTPTAHASTAYGALSNFDAVNDTGVQTHGFEIELDDVHSTAVQYTYDWNHYGHPTITEDNTDPLHPKTFVRYESKKDAAGNYLSYTAVPVGAFPPTQGHQCTNPAVNQGCEHFGVSYYAPSAVKYHWLVDNPSAPGNLILGPEVLISAPAWNYQPPVFNPPVANVPPVVKVPAQVVAVIPAPPAPVPVAKQFGKPSWVKVIKTQLHNNKDIPLDDLISGDKDGDGKADWANGEVAEVESEWYLLQTNSNGNAGKMKLPGQAEVVNKGENVTRRYEFYKYAGSAASIDGETDEAMCDAVATDGIHGTGIVGVTDANGDTKMVDCGLETVIGDYNGAQMVGFDAAAPLGLIGHIEDGETLKAYTKRTVVVGGNTPYVTKVTGGALPAGLTINSATGVLSGTPKKAGVFNFTVNATDKDKNVINKAYSIKVIDPLALVPVVKNATLAAATEGKAYKANLLATGGLPPYTWAVNALPDGLSLAANGLLSGTPTPLAVGVNAATYTVTDQAGQSDSKTLSLTTKAVPHYTVNGNGAGKITAIGNHFIVVNAHKIIWDTNTVYTLNVAPAIVKGMNAVWTGMSDPATGNILASQLTIN
jgi:hypothetical protein